MGNITLNGHVVTSMFIDQDNPQILRIETTARGESFKVTGVASPQDLVPGTFVDGILAVNAQGQYASILGENVGKRIGEVTTTDATPTTALTIPITDETVTRITVRIITRDQAGTSAQRAFYTVEALVYREAAGNATIQGAANQITVIESTAGMDGTITVSGANALVTVTGIAATDLNWHVAAEVQELS